MDIDADGQCPDQDFSLQHAHAEQQTYWKVQQKSGIGNRRAHYEKAPRQDGEKAPVATSYLKLR